MESLISNERIFLLYPKVGAKTFEVTHQQFSENRLEKTIQYEMKLVLLNNLSPNEFVYEIDMSHMLIDGKEPDLIFDQLAYECGKTIFPLKFLVNKFGEIVQIYEHPKMVENWELIKKKLLNYYEGESALNYIQLMDRNIKKPEIIKKMMQNHLFIYFFFKPIYGIYQDNYANVTWKSAHFMDFHNDITILQTLKTGNSDKESVDVLNDEVQIEIKSDSDEIEITGKYTFNPKHNSIDSCEASIKMDYGREIKLNFITKQEEIISN